MVLLDIDGCMILLHCWAWERITSIAPLEMSMWARTCEPIRLTTS